MGLVAKLADANNRAENSEKQISIEKQYREEMTRDFQRFLKRSSSAQPSKASTPVHGYSLCSPQSNRYSRSSVRVAPPPLPPLLYDSNPVLESVTSDLFRHTYDEEDVDTDADSSGQELYNRYEFNPQFTSAVLPASFNSSKPLKKNFITRPKHNVHEDIIRTISKCRYDQENEINKHKNNGNDRETLSDSSYVRRDYIHVDAQQVNPEIIVPQNSIEAESSNYDSSHSNIDSDSTLKVFPSNTPNVKPNGSSIALRLSLSKSARKLHMEK
jgi:hypothetical protein